MSLVAFDESGNTGVDLLNQQQRVFVLASSDLSTRESEELLSVVLTHQASEAKFSKLKKSVAGRRRIIKFLKSTAKFADRIKTSFFHKEYMVVTKIVDLIIETMAYRDGIDLYKDGANIATANMHYYCMSTYCGNERTREMYEKFVEMVRFQSISSINNFFYAMRQLHGSCIDKSYRDSLTPILASKEIIQEILESSGKNYLDPAIPAFFQHCAHWGDKFEEHFDVLHDDSKPLFQEKETLELFMSKDLTHQIVGYDRRKYGLPLKANGVFFGNSKKDSRLQVVDLVASSSGYWAHRTAAGETDNDFYNDLEGAGIQKFALNLLWPTPKVTPEELGTDGGYGVNAADYMTEQLAKHRK
jgi:hypothetical protein